MLWAGAITSNVCVGSERCGCSGVFVYRASKDQLDAAKSLGAPVVEIHTGAYCDAETDADREHELERIRTAVKYGASIGLEIHAGHGLNYDTVKPIAAMPEIAELNIGHFLIGEAIFVGLDAGIAEMRRLMDEARAETDQNK